MTRISERQKRLGKVLRLMGWFLGSVTLSVGGVTIVSISLSLELPPEPSPRSVTGARLPLLTPAAAAQAEVACVVEEEARVEFSRAFGVRGGARCPGGGCLFRSSSCNRASQWVSYEAPSPYYVHRYWTEDEAMNDGSISNLHIAAYDPEGRALKVQVLLTCDPPDHPGAGGGWARATLSGIERLRNEEAVKQRIRARCRVRP